MNEKVNEKSVESKLSIELDNLNISPKHIIYDPLQHEITKKMFENCSKKNTNNRGIPDRIIFCENTIIIIELKSKDIKGALEDLKIYKKKMKNTENYKIYFITYTIENYCIYDENFVKLDHTLKGLINKVYEKGDFNKNDMMNSIRQIHNFIRDKTRISDTDKGFFIAIILLALKNESFPKIVNTFNKKEYIYDVIASSVSTFKFDISIFEPMRTDSNNIHFFELIKMVSRIFEQCTNIDLLSLFYTEFVRYNNLDSKSLGIVLTPDYITDLMVNLAEITSNDVVLDLATGTGTFLLKSLNYNPKKTIGVEFKNNIFQLLRINYLLRDISEEKYRHIKGDCFHQSYDSYGCSKSIINPPYGQKDHNELEFIGKQIDSIKEGGYAISIIPSSVFSRKSKKRDDILAKSFIHTIVKLNKGVFLNSGASVDSVIIIKLQKDIKGHHSNIKTHLVDYTDDGFENKRTKGRIKSKNFDLKFKNIINQLSNDGNLQSLDLNVDLLQQFPFHIDLNIDKKTMIKQKMEIQYRSNILQTDNLNTQSVLPDDVKTFFIPELFDVCGKPKEEYKQLHKVNVCAALKRDNGVKCISMSNKNTFPGNKILVVVGGSGGGGMAFYQRDPFNIISSTKVLDPKFDMDENTGIFISNQLCRYKLKYNYGYNWTIDRMKNDVVYLPWKNDNIDVDFINNLF